MLQVIDPRMPTPPPGQLADRSAKAQSKVLLLDNGKLDVTYGPYREIFVALDENLRATAECVTVSESHDLLAANLEHLDSLADSIRAAGFTGVVIALCDWGVGQPSALLATRLERLGIPTCLVATSGGHPLVDATVRITAPGLPIVVLQSLRHASHEEIRQEIHAVTPSIVEALSQPVRPRDDATPTRSPLSRSPSESYLEIKSENAVESFTDVMASFGLGDGLLLIPPTEMRVRGMLHAMGGSDAGSEVVWPAVPPRTAPVILREIATIAVMAGLPHESAPVVRTAFEAMSEQEFRLFQAAITTHPSGVLVLVSGPRSEEFGLTSGRGCLGPGVSANVRIGRAIALGAPFLLGAVPGMTDLSAQGSPAEISYCCAENLGASPWPGLHVDLGHTATTVTVVKGEAPHNVTDQMSSAPEPLLDTFCSVIATLGANSVYNPNCPTVVLMNPEHARIIADAGWKKSDVRQYIFENARVPRASLQGRGLAPIWPETFQREDAIPCVTAPDDIYIAVVGGPGPASQIVIPWGYSRAVTRAIPTQH